MRLAILADVHGNLPALEAVLDDMRAYAPQVIVVAGDHLSGGPYPLQTMRRLWTLDAKMIRGNADEYMLALADGSAPPEWQGSAQWAVMRWIGAQLDAPLLAGLRALPEQRTIVLPGTAPIRVVHGSPRSSREPLYPDRTPTRMRDFARAHIPAQARGAPSLAQTLAALDEPLLVCGHTHIPWQQAYDGRLALNPGSVGAPINRDPRAQYALLEWAEGRWRVEHRAVPYDVDRVRAAYTRSGLLEQGGGFARAYLCNVETGQNAPWFLVQHAYALAREAGIEHAGTVPDDIWNRAVKTFDWKGVQAK